MRALETNTTIWALDLAKTQITNEGLLSILDMLKVNKTLCCLNIKDNDIKWDDPKIQSKLKEVMALNKSLNILKADNLPPEVNEWVLNNQRMSKELANFIALNGTKINEGSSCDLELLKPSNVDETQTMDLKKFYDTFKHNAIFPVLSVLYRWKLNSYTPDSVLDKIQQLPYPSKTIANMVRIITEATDLSRFLQCFGIENNLEGSSFEVLPKNVMANIGFFVFSHPQSKKELNQNSLETSFKASGTSR